MYFNNLDKVLHKIKNINILYNTTIVHLLDCARLWAPTRGTLSACVLGQESAKRKVRISVRERVRRLTKKMRAEVLQSRDTGDDGEGSGVDFGGEDLKETMDPKPEPL